MNYRNDYVVYVIHTSAYLYKPESYVDTRFLTVYQSLEVYDRLRGEGKEHDEPMSEPPKGEHLMRLIREHTSTMIPLFGGNVQEAVANVVRYRNFVVHRDSPIGDDPQYGRNLFWLTQRLMFLMKACFLTELGISDRETIEILPAKSDVPSRPWLDGRMTRSP